MDVLEFIASLVKSLAWPAALVVALYLMRSSVAKLFESLAKRIQTGNIRVEGAGWKALVSESLEDANEALEQIPDVNLRSTAAEKPTRVLSNDLEVLAVKDPESAVLKCWELVEQSLRDYASRHNFRDPDAHPKRLIALLPVEGTLDRDAAVALNRLFTIRSVAAHDFDELQHIWSPPTRINRADALGFVTTASRLIAYLDSTPE